MNETREHLTAFAGALWGGLVGDALGVPVEFSSRRSLDKNPVTDMRAYGTYNQPAGTWSDDSSMALVCMEVMPVSCLDPEALLQGFVAWMDQAWWTPHGLVFDIGMATQRALGNFAAGASWTSCGLTGEGQNGNGSLMRAMPVSLYLSTVSETDRDALAAQCSLLTHAHLRSQLCCRYHAHLVSALLRGLNLSGAMRSASAALRGAVPDSEAKVLQHILSGAIVHAPRRAIRGSGYVVHCLEASLWCLANSQSFTDAVLLAVNLGEDTDTTACVTGGLAGLLYGVDAIPSRWRQQLARHDDLHRLIECFITFLEEHPCPEASKPIAS